MSIQATSHTPYFQEGIIRDGQVLGFAEEQLSHEHNDTIEIRMKHPNPEVKEEVSTKMGIWGNAKVDLTRYGELYVNNEKKPVYCTQPRKNLWGKEIPKDSPTAEGVVKTVLNATGQDWGETMLYAKLLQQNSTHLAHHEVFGRNNLLDTKDLRVIEKRSVLKVHEKTFEVSNEILAKIIDRNDPEEEDPRNTTYAKMKVEYTGNRHDLLLRKFDQVETTVYHTAQYKTEKEARKAEFPKDKKA